MAVAFAGSTVRPGGAITQCSACRSSHCVSTSGRRGAELGMRKTLSGDAVFWNIVGRTREKAVPKIGPNRRNKSCRREGFVQGTAALLAEMFAGHGNHRSSVIRCGGHSPGKRTRDDAAPQEPAEKDVHEVSPPELSSPVQPPAHFKYHVDPRTVVALILGGGAGTRLFPLTRRRAKPAVPIGGAYRLIDVPMSNCINSGINKIFILTQFNSTSLNRHLARSYSFGNGVNFGDGFVEVLAATQTPGESGMNWFMGTADAVRQFTWLFEDAKNKSLEHVVILSGDHLYRMDYMDFVQKHAESGADITISCVPMEASRASDYGLMKIDHTGRVLYFNEKPKGESLKAMEVDTTVLGLSAEQAKKTPYIASMGIYVFRKDILMKLLRWRYPLANDFGSEILPVCCSEFSVQAYLFDDYWEDIGTIKSFFDANLALTEQPPKFKFYDAVKPIFTSPRYLPPTKVEKCRIMDSIVSHGCILRDCSVQHSVVGVRSRLENGVELKDTMMMGADYYETDAEMAAMLAHGEVPLGVGENSKIRNCIIDKNSRIGRNVTIANADNVEEADKPSEGYYIRSGITIILKNSTIKDGTVI